MKKHTLSIALAAALALPGLALSMSRASAQDAGAPAAGPEGDCAHRHGRGRGHHDPERRLAHLTEALQLDASQVALVRQVMEQARSEHEALRARPRTDETRAQHRAIMERTAQRIDAVLTPAQRTTFERMRAEHRARMERRIERRQQHGDGADPRGI